LQAAIDVYMKHKNIKKDQFELLDSDQIKLLLEEYKEDDIFLNKME